MNCIWLVLFLTGTKQTEQKCWKGTPTSDLYSGCYTRERWKNKADGFLCICFTHTFERRVSWCVYGGCPKMAFSFFAKFTQLWGRVCLCSCAFPKKTPKQLGISFMNVARNLTPFIPNSVIPNYEVIPSLVPSSGLWSVCSVCGFGHFFWLSCTSAFCGWASALKFTLWSNISAYPWLHYYNKCLF